MLTAKEGDLRLSGYRKVTLGRLEVYHAGQWGTVCNIHTDTAVGHVACRQLGYLTDVIMWHSSFHRNVPPDPIWLSSLICSGTENSLLECGSAVLGDQSDFCTHSEDFKLECDPRPRADSKYPISMADF